MARSHSRRRLTGFHPLGWIWLCLLLGLRTTGEADDAATVLPKGVRAVWDLSKAFHEATPTRERICLNGLWRWQPATNRLQAPPLEHWGYFKVPGSWPGITDYMQKDSQTLFAHPAWTAFRAGEVTAAWQEREIQIPASWTNRVLSLQVETLNSLALVWVDGKKVGELHFPGGSLDLTRACRPGESHRLTLQVVALPLKAALVSYTDSASAREVQGSVARRGLCGDVFLVATPTGPQIVDTQIETSVRRRELVLSVAMQGLDSSTGYRLHAEVRKQGSLVHQFTSSRFASTNQVDGRIQIRESWMPDRLWDLHTPENQLTLHLSLLDPQNRVCDRAWEQRFGFREFWIEGRDFVLNGTRLFLSAVPLDNAQVSAALASYDAARESLLRLKSFGINYVYTHHYGCEPGAHLSMGELLRAADDVGMLVGFTQPHFSHYAWTAPNADAENGYRRHAEFYVGVAGNHPAVVSYVMSHNATGYEEDMNPDLTDGVHAPRDTWAAKNVALARRAEAIVHRLDPRLIIYHHASGNLGPIHNSNFYPNFAPIQELDDWFEPWARSGVKPVFTCEYGAPFSWDWTLYRGWYKGQREWGSAQVPWEYCVAEWNAQFLGDAAYQISEAEKANLRWEAKQVRAGRVWHRWDYPTPVGSERFDECDPIYERYLTSNWRAYRTWGVSGISPWEFAPFWKLRPGVDRGRQELPVDWDQLQRPGFSADFQDQRFERMDLAYQRSDWIPTAAARSLLRNNRPLLAYIAGKPESVTSKDHLFRAGESVKKQLVILNNSRVAVRGDVRWSTSLPGDQPRRLRVHVSAGDQQRVPLEFALPAGLKAGSHEIQAEVRFDGDKIETQEDHFRFEVLAQPPAGHSVRPAVVDPQGETQSLLRSLGIPFDLITANDGWPSHAVIILGKGALTLEGTGLDWTRIRDGQRLVVLEQNAEVLEKRLGFRVQEYGLRQAFPRIADHPILRGITTEQLRDWRGSSTLVSPQLAYVMRPRYGPTVERAGLLQTRVWRRGTRGTVASVLIEKPGRGDFRPLIDGGFSLQYTPLLEFHQGKGLVLFCQLDVTGRTESDPAAEALVRNMIQYAQDWRPSPVRQAFYIGVPQGKTYLESLGIDVRSGTEPEPGTHDVLIVGPRVPNAEVDQLIPRFLQGGGTVLALGLDGADPGSSALGGSFRKAEYIATTFPPFDASSAFAGIGPADLHNRDPREVSLVVGGARPIGGGVLAASDDGHRILFQLAPWQFQEPGNASLRRTFRRVSTAANQVLANLGVAGSTPILARLGEPVAGTERESQGRWRQGLYSDLPEEWDDPYRFFRW